MVSRSVAEFVCSGCGMVQKPQQEGVFSHVQAQGIDPSKIQVTCDNCKAVLNVPQGLNSFDCLECHSVIHVNPKPSHSLPHSLLPEKPTEVASFSSFVYLTMVS